MKKLIFIFKILFEFILEIEDSIITKVISAKKHNGPKDILIVRIDRIGDFIIWLDAAKELKSIYPAPEHKITLVANEINKELALSVPYWDEVIAVDMNKLTYNLFYRWKFLSMIRQKGYDAVINPVFSRKYFFGDSIARVSGARERIGFDCDNANITAKQRLKSDKWYTKLIRPANNDHKAMELLQNANFIRGLKGNDFKSSLPSFKATGKQPDWFDIRSDFYIIMPAASYFKKTWPLDRFADLAQKIYDKTRWPGVICGSSEDVSLGEELKRKSGIPLFNICGKTSLLELFNIISKAKLLTGNDSAGTHMASSVSTPSLCVLGGGHFGRFLPYQIEADHEAQMLPITVYHKMDCYNCNWRCIYDKKGMSTYPCIEKVSVKDVWEHLEGLLEKITKT